MAKIDKNGAEILDMTPLSIPVGAKRPEPLSSQVARLVRTEMSKMAQKQGMETFEEAEDFDVGDGEDFTSAWEEQFEGQFDQERQLEATHYETRGNERIRKQRAAKKAAVEAKKETAEKAVDAPKHSTPT